MMLNQNNSFYNFAPYGHISDLDKEFVFVRDATIPDMFDCMTVQLYVIRAGEFRKIGIAKNVGSRFAQIRTSHRNDPALQDMTMQSILTVTGAETCKIEKAVHVKLKELHVGHEWFEAPLPLVIEAIRDVVDDFNDCIAADKPTPRDSMSRWREVIRKGKSNAKIMRKAS